MIHHKRVVALILVVLTMLSIATIPALAKRGYSTVSNKGTALQFPDEDDFLRNMKAAKVKASRANGSIYIMPMPKSGHGNMGNVLNNETVYIIAKHKQFYFFVNKEGHFGWNNTKYFKIRNTVTPMDVVDVIENSDAETLFWGDDDYNWFMLQMYDRCDE